MQYSFTSKKLCLLHSAKKHFFLLDKTDVADKLSKLERSTRNGELLCSYLNCYVFCQLIFPQEPSKHLQIDFFLHLNNMFNKNFGAKEKGNVAVVALLHSMSRYYVWGKGCQDSHFCTWKKMCSTWQHYRPKELSCQPSHPHEDFKAIVSCRLWRSVHEKGQVIDKEVQDLIYAPLVSENEVEIEDPDNQRKKTLPESLESGGSMLRFPLQVLKEYQ